MEEVLQFLSQMGTFYLASMDGDQPRVRPFGAVMGYEGKLYLITNNQKEVWKQLTKNPKVELCACNEKGEWLRVSAVVVPDPRMEAKTAMLEANPNLKNMYQVDDGVMTVFYLKEATAIFSSFMEAPKTIVF